MSHKGVFIQIKKNFYLLFYHRQIKNIPTNKPTTVANVVSLPFHTLLDSGNKSWQTIYKIIPAAKPNTSAKKAVDT